MIILFLGLLSGCVTKKSRDDQSKIGQYYHNLTSRFNGWFNANELVNLSVATLEDQHVDNFNEILPIYKYSAVDNADAVKADLDEAIKKVSVVVTLHEHSDWVDDCYLLIGKSLYLKKDYEAAENALEFYMDEFLPTGKRATLKNKRASKRTSARSAKNSSEAKEANKRKKELQKARKKAEKERKKYNKELRKRKKKGKSTDDLVRPGTTKAADGTTTIPLSEVKKYEPTAAELKAKAKAEGDQANFFLRAAAYDEAILWLAKSYIERENWTAADYQFRRLEGDDILPPRVYEELPVARAYYHLQRENYPQVIPFLEQAIERAKDRADKARYSYIIAQLHYRDGRVEEARAYYQKALDFSNDYDMIFNTQLSIIRSSVKNNTMTRADAMSQLEKMVKDIKNESYLGRIYYLMGTMAVDNNEIAVAIEHLEKSVETVGDDVFQQVESQFLVATLYMQEKMYVEAEQAYKACAAIMKTTDPRYKTVKKLADNLIDIAVNLNTIALQDSLLYLSTLTPEQLKIVGVNLKRLKQKEAEEAAAKNKSVAAQNKFSPGGSAASPGGFPQMPQAPGVIETKSNVFWAFDDKNTKKYRREFDRVWNDIPLTDYWRVSAKSTQYASTAESEADEAVSGVAIYESEIEDFFKDVPKTDSARAISHSKIRKSMLLLGSLYRDRLDDFKSSIDIMESLLSKYPDAPEELETFYQLYLSSLSAGDHARAEKYKALLIAQYPNSRFARVLSDPNFAAEQMSERDRLIQYYDETFVLFSEGKHEEVLNRVREVEDKFGANNELMAKFDMLKAMSLGAQIGKEAYVDGLKHVIARYPNSDEQRKAKDMLLLLGDSGSGKSYGEAGLESATFTMEDNALHFAIVYVSNQDKISLSDTKIALAEFHKKYFQLDNLKMASLVFDPSKNHSLVLVRSFNTKEKAMTYHETAIRNPKDFLPADAIFEVYPITQKNYREVIKARSLAEYKTFFEANY